MKKVTIGNATLYHGDCLEIMPTLDKVDCVVTDPPYEFDASGAGIFRSNRICMDKIQEKNLDQGFDIYILDLSLDLGAISIAVFFHWDQQRVISDFFERSDLKKSALCVWQKTNPMPVANKHYQPELEYWWHSWKKPFGVCGNGLLEKKRVYTGPVGQCDIDHPTVKPLPLMEKIIRNASQADFIVLDPYMGSGTTGVACAKLNRKFIGIERDETYFNIACERIQAAYDQPDLFIEQPEKIEQIVMEDIK